ncbi:hypothetical protein V2J09_011774 [Rumex salicifolius]
MSPSHNPQTSMASNSHLLFHISFYFLTLTNLICCIRAQADNYIVHMDLGAMPKTFTNHHTWYKSTLDSLSTTTTITTTTTTPPPPSKLLYTFNHAISGFSASLTPSELKTLKSLPGYLHATRDSSITLDTTYTSKFLGLNPLSGAWPASDYGRDVIVGVVDCGVWPESKSFDDNGYTPIPSQWKGTCEIGTEFNSSMCNRKLIGAQYFNKGLLASNPNLNISMNSARDTDGHGTHTSSTVVGSHVDNASYFGYAIGNATGMAPHARVAVYKAVWEEGSSTIDVLAAVDKAIADGVDVISISLGADVRNIYDDVIAIATFAAVEKGIFVSLSAGNSGSRWGTLHNGTPWALTIAAGTTDRQLGGTVTLGNGDSVNGLSLYPESTNNSSLTLMNDCNDLGALKRLQKDIIVVCLDLNGTALSDQVYNVATTKVAGAIFITESVDLNLFLQSLYPAIFLDYKAGKLVTDYIKSTSDKNPTASLHLQKTFLGSMSAPKLASYSSRGPSPTCRVVLKPDLMAPGDLILASWSRSTPVAALESRELYNNFNVISGTSMACPHASGVAALLKGAHPEWTPAMIRSAMMTSADTLDGSGEQIKDMGRSSEKASALAMGAGHMNPNKAMDPGLVYDTEYHDYIDLLCALNYTKEQMKVITRSSSIDCSSPGMDLNYPSFILVAPEGSEEAFEGAFWRTVTSVGDGAITYNVKVSMGDGVEVRVEPETLVFGKKYEKLKFKVVLTVASKMEEEVVDGSLSWIDSEGKYAVRSPIVVSAIPDKTH